ncbi:MAG: group II intron reverse transcriptase/maturase [Nitrosomonas sp.]|uniref:group II intron reverse transcriptase/maturase n=1 Tax=Nitrosomonas sp. TaxID=42353 RepID=UPI0025E6467D|nr:group II intron reverse transcriptase/maturase [Nitrosomonas sp.]UJP01987.1 MAG: group II intron reverse transcriptase/maturase [Nitrosomonas sp.]
MSIDEALHQKLGQPERMGSGRGEAPHATMRDEATLARHAQADWGVGDLLGQALARENMAVAWKRVKANKGSAGVDGRTVQDTGDYLKIAWPEIRRRLLDGIYRPSPVRRVDIPKPGGGSRELGIPTVVDRLIQQALLQVLQPLIDPTFSEHSHGFRPGHSAHDAVMKAQQYVQAGYGFVVDVDLEKFFDRVNHDILMDRLAKRIADKRMLRLIRRYLQAGILAHGIRSDRFEGTPQGGPLSPLLANVLLDDVDRELERRGHKFVRYADDCNVYVKSQRAGERILRALRGCYAKPALKVNESKTAVAKVWGRKFLGYCLYATPKGEVKLAVADQAMYKLRERIRQITRRLKGRSLKQISVELRDYVTGWRSYFRLAQTPRVMRELDEWLRHRLRSIQLKQWRNGITIFRELRKLGASVEVASRIAGNARSWWRNSHRGLNKVLSVSYFDSLGIPKFS